VADLSRIPWDLFGHDSQDDWFTVELSEPLAVLVGRGPRLDAIGAGFHEY